MKIKNKKNLNWMQAKSRYPRLNPFGDVDRDGVKNKFDCRPFNRKRQEEEENGSSILLPSKPSPPKEPIIPPGWMHKGRIKEDYEFKKKFFIEEINKEISHGRILNMNLGNKNMGLLNYGSKNFGNLNVDNRLSGVRRERKGPF